MRLLCLDSAMANLTLADEPPTKASSQVQVAELNKSKTFFDLPFELRLKIYENLVCFHEPIELSTPRMGLLKSTTHPSELPLHMFLVSKDMYLEASLIFYKCNKFRVQLWPVMMKPIRPGQLLCNRLNNLELQCNIAHNWGYVRQCKDLALLMPQLQRLELSFDAAYSSEMIATANQLSNAIATCTPMFNGPQLRLSVWVRKSRVSADKLKQLEQQARKRTSGPDGKTATPFVSLLQSEMPNLTLIQLTCGEIEETSLPHITQHTCSPGDCTWIPIKEEKNKDGKTKARSVALREFTWGKTDAATTVKRPEVDMRQWYPKLSDASQKTLRELFATYDQSEGSSRDQKIPSDTAEATQENDVPPHTDITTPNTANDPDDLFYPNVMLRPGHVFEKQRISYGEASYERFIERFFPTQNEPSSYPPTRHTNPIFPRETHPTNPEEEKTITITEESPDQGSKPLEENNEDSTNDEDRRARRPFFCHSDESDSDTTTVVAESRISIVESWLRRVQTLPPTTAISQSSTAELSVSPGKENDEATTTTN